MRFKDLDQVDTIGYEGKLYRIDVIVFDSFVDNGVTIVDDFEYWYDKRHNIWCHPMDAFFTNLDEAQRWCKAFTPEMVGWTHRMGNGPEFENVAIDITEMYHDEYLPGKFEWIPGYVAGCYDWIFNKITTGN